MVCHSWNDLLQSPPGLELLLNESKFYLITPHLCVVAAKGIDTIPDVDSDEDEEELASTRPGLPIGEINCSTIVTRAFSVRQIYLDIVRRYREIWQDLIFLGGDYQPHRNHKRMVVALQLKQDEMKEQEEELHLDPYHFPYLDEAAIEEQPDERDLIYEPLNASCKHGELSIRLADYGETVYLQKSRPKFNILCASGITATTHLL